MPGTTNAAESYGLVSSYGIYDREVAKKLNIKYPRASALSWMRAAEGYMSERTVGKKKVNRHEYSYWEENQWLNASAIIESAANSTDDVVLTLEEASHQNSGTESYPIVTDLCVFPDETVGYVIAVDKDTDDAHTVTVRKLNSSQDVQTAGAALGVVVFYSDAQQEKSTAPESRIPKQTKITNKLQTFRKMYEWTDHSAQNVTEWEHNGSNLLHVKGSDDTANLFAYAEEVGMLITPQSSGLVNAGSNAVQTTQALLPQIRSGSGGEFTYTTAPAISDVETWSIAASDRYAGTKFVLGMGINIHVKWNSVMKDFMVENPTPFFTPVNDSKADGKQKYTFDFAGIKYGDFEFFAQKWDVLSHKDTLGATGHPYRDMMVCLPIGETRDPDSGDMEPYIKIAYANPGGAKSENKGDHKIWQTGANALPRATNDEMNTEIHWISYKGFELRHINKFFLWTKA